MVGIPVNVADTVSTVAGFVSAGADIAENFITNKPKKDILKDVKKFGFKGNFDRMSDLIKTINKK
jgi:hypothetical protein